MARRKPDSAHPDWPVLYLTVRKDNAGVASRPVAKPKNYGSQPGVAAIQDGQHAFNLA